MKKDYLIALIAFILIFSLPVFSKNESTVVSKAVFSKAQETDKIPVIITFKEERHKNLRSELRLQNIKKSQERFISSVAEEKGFAMGKRYSSQPAITATISNEMLQKLMSNPSIESIIYDMPIHAFLNDSVSLVEAPFIWNTTINGLSVRGDGETICLVDTGIDYRHAALGSCNNIRLNTTNGDIYPYSLTSPINYPNSANLLYTINYTGFTSIAVHFMHIGTEAKYDNISIYNASDDLIANYSGVLNDVWTPSVPGDTIYVRLKSDEIINATGFIIDAIINGSANTSMDFSSCNKTVGGWNFVYNSDDPRDDENHGTHLAGIIASLNSTYPGVAPGAKLAAVKVLDGNGYGTESDLEFGMEWCIDNSERLNITVISMSLGNGNYSANCDSSFTVTSALVREANLKNISVIAASGNSYNKTGIAWPACLENVTSVGATSKSDTIPSYSQSGQTLDLLAPGEEITSIYRIGGFIAFDGTSMAAPHVSGAFALLRNFKRLENGTILTPRQMQNALVSTGINITDTNGLSVPRINITGALLSIDDIPRISFVSVALNQTAQSQNFTFVNFSASEPLKNATIEIDAQNYSMNGSNRNFFYNKTGLADGSHNFTVYVTDSTNNRVRSAQYIFTVDTVPPNITINSPINHSITSSGTVILNLSTTEVSTCDFSFNNSYYNSTLTDNSTSHVATLELTDGLFNLTVNCTDSAGGMTISRINFTVDTLAPAILFRFPQDFQIINTFNLTLNYSINESNFDRAWFRINSNSTLNYTTPQNTSGGNITLNITLSRPGKTTITFFSNDTASNLANRSLSFYLNESLNITQWISEINSSNPEVLSFNVLNSASNVLTGSGQLPSLVTVEMNLTNITVEIVNFSGINATWDSGFAVSINDSSLVSGVGGFFGTFPLDYVRIANFSSFLNDTGDYYGKIKLPRNISYYDFIYYCANDNIGNCTQVAECSAGFTQTTSEACYNYTSQNVFVYVPHFSSVFGSNDSIPPELNITLPQNNSVIVDSMFNLSISVGEANPSTETFCNYTLYNGTNLLAYDYDIDSGEMSNYLISYTYTVQLYNVTNGQYNLTVSCKDSSMSTTKKLNLTVLDSTLPAIVSSGPSGQQSTSSTSLTVTLSATTDERTICKYQSSNVSFSSMTTFLGSNESYAQSHTGTRSYSSDDSSENYYVACQDVNGMVSTRLISYSVNVAEPSSSSGSSGSSSSSSSSSSSTSSASSENTKDKAKSSQVFVNPSKGEHTMNIPTVKLAFTQIVFSLRSNVSGNAVLMVEKIDLPKNMTSLNNTVYQYLKVDKTIIKEENIESALIKFRVEKSWITDNVIDPAKVSLYRYQQGWAKLLTNRTAEDSSYFYYIAASPELSYYGISGDLLAAQEAIPAALNDSTKDTTASGEVIREVEKSGIKGDDDKSQDLRWLLILPLGFIMIILLSLAGFLIYKKNTSVLSDSELRDIREYVENSKAEGIADASIKTSLEKSGWPEYVIELIMHDVHMPTEEITKLGVYVLSMREKGKTDEEILASLKKVGWPDAIIKDSLSQNKKKQ